MLENKVSIQWSEILITQLLKDQMVQRVPPKKVLNRDQKLQDQVSLNIINSNKIIVEIKWDQEIQWCNKQLKLQMWIIWCQEIEFKISLNKWQWIQLWEEEKKGLHQVKEDYRTIKTSKETNRVKWCKNKVQTKLSISLKEATCIMCQVIWIERDQVINIILRIIEGILVIIRETRMHLLNRRLITSMIRNHRAVENHLNHSKRYKYISLAIRIIIYRSVQDHIYQTFRCQKLQTKSLELSNLSQPTLMLVLLEKQTKTE